MRDMLAREERDGLIALDRELESGQAKIKGLISKFTANIDAMNKAKESFNRLLTKSQTLAFLQV